MEKEILIRLRMKKRYISWFRVIMIILAVISLIPIWNAFADGYFVTRGKKFESNSVVIIFYCLKFFLLSALFIWFATGGVREKEE